MEARAELKYARISPRKVKIVLDLIRNKPCEYAMAVLKHTPKAACEDLEKLLKSAMANAENNHNMDVSKLYVAECFVKCFRHDPFCLSSVLRFLPFAGNIQLIFSLYTIYITSAIRLSCSVWHLFISILYFNM